MLVILIILIILAILIYWWGTNNHDFFQKRNIPHDKPRFLFGGGLEVLLQKKSEFELQCDGYKRHEGNIIYGTFDNRDPVLAIRDPQLIKQVLIKDFDHFVNRQSFFDESTDNLFNKSLFLMQDDRWRDMRSTLSPAFTGSKMRQMFQIILQTVNESMSYVKECQKGVNADEGYEMNVTDLTTRLTTDIIASTAFGLQVNSYRDKNNEFYLKAKDVANFTVWQQIRGFTIILMPKIAKLLNIDIIDKEFSDYFKSLVLDAMKYRKENNIHRVDMINLLMEATGMLATDTAKAHHRVWSDIELVAQCFVFLFAALDPLSGSMGFAAHELMASPEVQQKLFEEIEDLEASLEGKPISFEALQKMSYMDMVVSEVLRKWPLNLTIDRKCNKDFAYESVGELSERITIKKGDFLRIPMAAIQRDPNYFENPDEFNPERFSEENKSKIDNGTYLPFGLGPRNCIGNRFSLLAFKAFLYYLIRDYKLEASPKTRIPLELAASNAQFKPKHGFWIQFKSRT